jgi:methyl-accepting chemotaxis protein
MQNATVDFNRLNVGWFSNLKLTTKLSVLAALVLIPLFGAMAWSYRLAIDIDNSTHRVAEQRMPTVNHLSRMAFEIADSAAALRGYLLTGDAQYREARASAWRDAATARAAYAEEAKTFTDPRNIKAWAELDELLTRYKAAQDAIEGKLTPGARGSDALVVELRTTVAPLATRAAEIIQGDGKGDEGLFARQTKLLTQDTSTVMDQIDVIQLVIKFAGAIALLLLALGGFMMVRNVIRPLIGMTSAMNAVAAKQYDVSIPAIGQKDEVGAMANALAVFRDGLQANDRMEAEAARAREIEARRQATVTAAIASFETTAEQVVLTISSASTELEAAAKDLSHSAQEATMEASTVAASSAQATANINGLAAAGEELNATAGEIARLLDSSAASTRNAVERMRAADDDVQALAQSASKIGEVVELINGLASQTNLLALNATIEAARAGEAGRGFAVVAAEVKGLAAQTARATTEIAEIVNQIRSVTDRTVNAINSIDSAIKVIEHSTNEIAGTVGQQEKATREIAVNVQQAAQGAEDVSRAITHVSSAASNTAAASSQVLGSASDLSKQAETMRNEVQSFLATVRAA